MRSAERRFGAELTTARTARAFTRAALAEWGLDADDVVLVVGELAANALRHGQGPFTVRLSLDRAAVRAEVSDAGTGSLAVGRPPPDVAGGRGLQIVERLSTAWGCEPAAGAGKTVWAELPIVV